MSSTSPRQGLSKTQSFIKGIAKLRSMKTRTLAAFALVLLTAVLSVSVLTASTNASSLSSGNSQHAGLLASSISDLLGLLGFNTSGATAIDACSDAPPDAVACFKGEFNANDSRGANNGGWVGEDAYADGKVGSGAFSFSGNSHIEVADSPDLNPANITVDGWVNLANSRSFFDVASKGDSAYALRIVGQKLQFTSRNAKGEAEILESGEFIEANTWVHVAATHDGTTRRLYINGYEVASDAQDGLQTTDTGVLRMGSGGLIVLADDGAADKSFTRLADEVRIFSRALSAKEIKEIFAPGSTESDPNGVHFTVAAQNVAENVAGGTAIITIERGAAVTAGTVRFTTAPGSATAAIGSGCAPGDDYIPQPPNPVIISFPAGAGTTSIGITICDDTTPELSETFTATLDLLTGGGNVLGTAVHTVTIVDDDVTVSVAVSPAAVLENHPTDTLNYTFTRNNTLGAQTFNLATSGQANIDPSNTCVVGADWTGSTGAGASAIVTAGTGGPGTVTFAAGSATAVIIADPCADTVVEPDEQLIFTLTAGTGYSIIAPSVATGTITNDDFPTVSVAVAPAAVLEGDPGNPQGALTYTFTRSSGALGALPITYTTTGSATSGTDYPAQTGMVTFPGSDLTVAVVINPSDDIVVETDETLIVTVTGGTPTTYSVGAPASATGTITNDDEDVTVTVAGSPILEDAAGVMTYTFTRVGTTGAGSSTADALSVNFSVTGTATNGTDYVLSSASPVVFGAGVLTAQVTVDPTVDLVPESNETVTLTVTAGTTSVYGIGNPNAAPAGTHTATGTINNDDFQVIVNNAPTNVLEDSGTPIVYTFTRLGGNAPVGGHTVNFNATGTATAPGNAGADYNVAGHLTFTAAGQGTIAIPQANNAVVGGVDSTTVPFNVTPIADTGVEPDETVIVQVDNGTNYTPGTPAQATGNIINDDTVVTVEVSPTSSNEDTGPNMIYTFTRTANLGVTLNVPYTVTGSAIANDYTGSAPGAQVAVFAPGQATTTVTVDPTADTVVEPDETVVFTLNAAAPGSGYTLGTPSVATGTILNDDTDVNITLAGSPIFENAAGFMTYTFTRTGLISGNLTVNFSTTGTATTGTDYVPSATGTVTFIGASPTATVTVDPSPDSDIEPDETVILTVLPGTGYNVGGVTPSQTGTITSDDVDVQLNAAVANTPVLENGTNNLIYTIQRVTGSTLQEVTVPFTIGGGTNPATCGDDYDVLATAGVTFSNLAGCSGAGTAVIAAGSSSTTVTVDPRGDVVVEPDETVRMTLNSCAGSGASAGFVNTCDLVAATSVDGVITNDDTDVSVAIAPPSIIEDQAGVMTYTFTRNTSAALLALPLNVNYNSSGTACGGTACADTFTTDFGVGLPTGSTYNGTNGTGTGATSNVQFAAGSTTAVITVDPTADTNIEPDETVILTVIAGTGYTPVTATAATGTIRDEDSSVQFTSATFTHNPEGSGGGTTTAALTVSRNGPGSATGPAQVDASTIQVGGTATGSNSCAIAGTDYVVISGQTISWAAAEAGNKPFNITICADDVDESNEILNSQLSNFVGTQIGSPLAAVTTIVDDDNPPSFALTPSTTTVAEGASATYTVTRSGNATQLSTTVTWTATSGTATAVTDFSPVSGTVTFPAGTGGTQTFSINALTDTLFEGNENFTVALTAATNGSAFSGTNTTTITDGNTAPTVAINDVSQVELNAGQSAFIFTITRTGDAQANQTMVASTQDGGGPTPATAPSDYTAISGDTVTFTQGQTSRQVAVIVNGDTTFEDDETFRVNLGSFNFGSATDGQGLGTILNDDGAPVFNLTATAGSPNETVTEGSGTGTTVARFTITKTGATELTSIVSASTVNGSAVAPGDFTAITDAAVATFGPLDTVKTFDINIVRDTIRENTETFTVNLTNVTNGTFGTPTTGTGTINDDEPNPNFALSAVSASNPEGTTATFMVTMNFPTGLSGTEVSSTLACASSVITPTNSSIHALSTDFSVTSNTISFAAGSATGSTRPCNFTTENDMFFEGAETFNVALSGTGFIGTVTPTTPLTATIVNNDACAFAASNVSQVEGNASTSNFIHNVTKTCDTGAFNGLVGYASSDGPVGPTGATAPSDYTEIVPGTLNFTPATTSLPLPVSVNGDLLVEQNETYNVLLTGATVNGVPVPNGACGTATCGITNGVGTILNDDGIPISISGTITNFSPVGPAAGVTVTLSGSSSATTVTNASGGYTFTGLPSGGNFLVTPTAPAGRVASPTTRSYTGITASVANANFVLYSSTAIPRTLNVVNSYTVPGSPVTVPIMLTAQGDEAALSGTLTYAAPLSAPTVACGSGNATCSLTSNTATPGIVTFSVDAQDGGGNPTVYAAGSRVVINVTFNTSATAAQNTPVNFANSPTVLATSDSGSNPLPTVYNNGFVVFQQGLESDVAGRTAGSGGVNTADVVQTRRFVAGLDTPDPSTNEFQRADAAPAGTRGNGILDSGDVIQSRRYAAFLDPTQTAGGPFVAAAPRIAPETKGGISLDGGESVNTILRTVNVSGNQGTQVFVDVELDSVVMDDVAGFGTSFSFDPTRVSISSVSGNNPDVTLGSATAGCTITANGSSVGAGRIGFVLDCGTAIAAGTNRQVARLRFTIGPSAPAGLTPVNLVGAPPIPQSMSNTLGQDVTFTNQNGNINIILNPTAAGVSVGGRVTTPSGAGLRGATVSITDAEGMTRTVTTSTFGYYQFEEVEAGGNYVIAVSSRRFRFAPRVIQVVDNLTDVNFQGQE